MTDNEKKQKRIEICGNLVLVFLAGKRYTTSLANQDDKEDMRRHIAYGVSKIAPSFGFRASGEQEDIINYVQAREDELCAVDAEHEYKIGRIDIGAVMGAKFISDNAEI